MSHPRPTRRPVVFLDRDGTIIEDVHYIARADQVTLIDGVAHAIRRLNLANWAVVVITNQSGIGRGLLSESDYASVRARVDELLAGQGALVDRHYHCPHAPTEACACRKPGTLLHEQAIVDLDLDPARVATVGDRWRDVQPAKRFGGRGILVPSPDTPPEEMEQAERDADLAPSLEVAVNHLLRAG